MGGIAETGFVRSATSVFAIRCSAGGVPADDHQVRRGFLSQRAVDLLTVLQRDADRPEAGRDPRVRIEQRLQHLLARQPRRHALQVRSDVRCRRCATA